MPKPLVHVQGSGMHTHLSLWRTTTTRSSATAPTASATSPRSSSPASSPRPEITAVTNQWVNSYKRLVPGAEAPVGPVGPATTPRPWCGFLRSSPDALTRRALSTLADPPQSYLAFAVVLAAGLRGVAGTTNCRRGRTHAPLPQSLAEALDLMEDSKLLHETLGPHQVEWFLRNKRAEWDAYRAKSRLRTRSLPSAAVIIDVVLCVPSCEGPFASIRGHGVTPPWLRPVASTRSRRSSHGRFRWCVINASAFPFTEAMNLCRQLRARSRGSDRSSCSSITTNSTS